MVKFNKNINIKNKAYTYIYLPNRKKYPLPFEEYEVYLEDEPGYHINVDDIQLLTPEEVTEREMHRLRHKVWENINV